MYVRPINRNDSATHGGGKRQTRRLPIGQIHIAEAWSSARVARDCRADQLDAGLMVGFRADNNNRPKLTAETATKNDISQNYISAAVRSFQ